MGSMYTATSIEPVSGKRSIALYEKKVYIFLEKKKRVQTPLLLPERWPCILKSRPSLLCFPLSPFWPLPRRVKDSDNFDRVIFDTVRNDIGFSHNHEFPCPYYPSGSAERGEFPELFNCSDNVYDRSCRAVLRNENFDVIEVSACLACPPDLQVYPPTSLLRLRARRTWHRAYLQFQGGA